MHWSPNRPLSNAYLFYLLQKFLTMTRNHIRLLRFPLVLQLGREVNWDSVIKCFVVSLVTNLHQHVVLVSLNISPNYYDGFAAMLFRLQIRQFWSCSSIHSFMVILTASSSSKACTRSDSFKYLETRQLEIRRSQICKIRCWRVRWCTVSL